MVEVTDIREFHGIDGELHLRQVAKQSLDIDVKQKQKLDNDFHHMRSADSKE